MSDLHDLLAQHRAVAGAATKGRWRWEGDYPAGTCPHDTEWCDHGPDLMAGGEPVGYASGYDASSFTISDIDAQHIALNDPEVALALNAVAEEARLLNECSCHHRCGLVPDKRLAATLTQLHEVMQRKMGDTDAD